MTRVSTALDGSEVIFHWSFSSYRKLRMLFPTVDVLLAVGRGVEVTGAFGCDLEGMVMRLKRGRRRCGRGGVGVWMTGVRAVLLESTGVEGSWRRRSDAESGEVRGTMKTGGFAVGTVGSPSSALSMVTS